MKKLVAVTLGLAAGLVFSQAAWAGQLKDGIDAVNHEDFGRGRSILEDYVKRFPNDPRPYYYLSKCYQSTFEVNRVGEVLESYRALSDKRSQILTTLQGSDKISVYRAMVADDPTDLSARLLLAISDFEHGSPMMAEAELEVIGHLTVPAELQDVPHALWGAIYQSQSNWTLARAELKEALRININNPVAPSRLSEIDAAERAQKLSLESKTFEHDTPELKSFELTYKLGKDLLDEGNFDGAIEALTQASSAKPDSVEAKNLLAVAMKKGAEQKYQTGIQFMRDSKYAAAYELFKQAVKLDPTFTKAQIAAQDARDKAMAQEKDSSNPVPTDSPSPAPLPTQP